MDTLSDRIKAARTAADLTQQQVADHFGIARVSVTQWENGTSRPSIERLPELARLLNVSEEWLLSNRGEPPRPQKREYRSKLDELIAGFPQLDPADQDRLIDMMRRLAASRASHEE